MLVNSPLVRLPGDYNDDGHVDSADYAVWRSYDYYGVYDLAADGNLDGVVDNLDYDVWRTLWPNSVYWLGVEHARSTAAPEPTPLVLISIVASAALAFRRQQLLARSR